MFAPLASRESRWKSFVLGVGIQAQLLAVVLVLNVLFPQHVQRAKKYMVVTLIAPGTHTVTDVPPVKQHVDSRVMASPLAANTPLRPTKLPPPPETSRKIERRESDDKAPSLNLLSKAPELPKLPNKPVTKVVAINTFATAANVIPTPSNPATQVQTGGFGDPNGIARPGGSETSALSAKGHPGLPVGAGFGNGLGGPDGTPGVAKSRVQSSGFDKQYITPKAGASCCTATAEGLAHPVEILSKPQPAYTEEGRKLGIEGEVQLQVRFTADGQVHVLKVLRGLGHGLDEQAWRCAEQIRFRPATHGGQMVDSTAIVHIIFQLAT